MHIGIKIKQRREELGLTQTELANKLGYKSKTTIAKIENGSNDITQSKVLAFAKALDTTPAYLMGWEEMQKNNDIIADIVIEMRSDKEFLSAAKSLYDLHRIDKDKFHSASQMLVALLK